MPTNENENPTVEKEKEKQDPATDNVDIFIDAAKEVKNRSVSKEEYEKVVADRKKLLDFILEGKELEKEDEANPSTPDVAELKKVFRDPDASNLEIVSASLGIRDAVLKETGKDPFSSSESDAAAAQRVADVFKQCVDEAKGDDEKFTYLLKSRISDDDAVLVAAIEKRKKALKKGLN